MIAANPCNIPSDLARVAAAAETTSGAGIGAELLTTDFNVLHSFDISSECIKPIDKIELIICKCM